MNANEQFEKNAAKFRKDTGIWPIGKDRAAAAGPIDERDVRMMAYTYWQKQQALQAENEKLKEKIIALNDHIAQLQAETNKPF